MSHHGSPFLDTFDQSIGHKDDAISQVKHPVVMCHHDHGSIGTHSDTLDEIHDEPARSGIKGCGRFIAYEQSRFIHEGPSDGHPLLLATGKLGGERVDPVCEADLVHHDVGSLHSFPAGDTPDDEWDGGILDSCQRRDQIVLLKHETDVLGAEADQPTTAQGLAILSEQYHFARRGIQ